MNKYVNIMRFRDLQASFTFYRLWEQTIGPIFFTAKILMQLSPPTTENNPATKKQLLK